MPRGDRTRAPMYPYRGVYQPSRVRVSPPHLGNQCINSLDSTSDSIGQRQDQLISDAIDLSWRCIYERESQFISHDLTPVRLIKGQCRVLQREAAQQCHSLLTPQMCAVSYDERPRDITNSVYGKVRRSLHHMMRDPATSQTVCMARYVDRCVI